jgi:hypothetical protein
MRQHATATLRYAVRELSLTHQASLGTMKCARLHQATACDATRQHATATLCVESLA